MSRVSLFIVSCSFLCFTPPHILWNTDASETCDTPRPNRFRSNLSPVRPGHGRVSLFLLLPLFHLSLYRTTCGRRIATPGIPPDDDDVTLPRERTQGLVRTGTRELGKRYNTTLRKPRDFVFTATPNPEEPLVRLSRDGRRVSMSIVFVLLFSLTSYSHTPRAGGTENDE